MDWAFFFLMVVLKLPVFAMLGIVWWAVRAVPEPEADANDDGGGPPKPNEPRPNTPRPGPRPRGPHGEPSPPSPARARPAGGTRRAPSRPVRP